MKNVIALLLASVIIGFVAFAISFWLFKTDKVTAQSIGISCGVGGLVGELLRPYLVRKFGKKNA
jgi:multisubunit Na+/H+ antiporter MnhE subunit